MGQQGASLSFNTVTWLSPTGGEAVSGKGATAGSIATGKGEELAVTRALGSKRGILAGEERTGRPASAAPVNVSAADATQLGAQTWPGGG